MRTKTNDPFYQSLPVFTRFEGVADARNYVALPDGWFLALADVTGSTKAIAAGRYKAVNMAGAAVISAILNELETQDYPFIFGGDGAMVAVPGTHAAGASRALANVRRWVKTDLGLTLRVALVPVDDIRAEGLDVSIARFGASPLVSYAMFNGGGANWAEQQMKAGRYSIDSSETGTPDLTGLSCRWSPIMARNGEIVSIIAKPTSVETMPDFRKLVAEIVSITAEQNRAGHPIPEEGPGLGFSGDGITAEVAATAKSGERLPKRLSILLQVFLTLVLHRLNLTLGRFNARQYTRDVSANSDFRKFDDGLKMTVDDDDAHRLRIEALLAAAEEAGICQYGLHRQQSALVTCLVLSPLSRDHIHFVDGAQGGYTLAAGQLASKHDGTNTSLAPTG